MDGPGRRLRSGLGSRLAAVSLPWRVLGAAVVTVVVLAAAFAITAPSSAPHQPGHAPQRAHSAGHAVRPGRSDSVAPAQDRLGPVLLVPGYGGETGSLDALASRIRAEGRQAIVLRLPGTGTGSLVVDA